MPQPVYILFGAAFTVAVMLALGRLLLQALGLSFRRQEQNVFALASGAACLSMIVFAMGFLHVARKGAFIAAGAAVLALAIRRGAFRAAGEPLPPLPRGWRIFFWVLFTLFTYVYFFNAMAPEHSPDGVAYHLALVARWIRARGFFHITTSMYANLSQGVELLFLFAFSIGKHSAAALVHYAFLAALPFAMMAYARRFGFPVAGTAAALLVYLSPIIGFDGASAYVDIAVAYVIFAIFYLLQIWDDERHASLLVLIGVLAGFAYAMKYTAVLAVPYAAGFVAWKCYRKGGRVLRPVLVVGLCAFAMMAPWLLRNWIWYDNPFSPFFNSWFPNKYIHIGLEQSYREGMATWGGVTDWREIPFQVTIRGNKLQGILGPVFLLAPVALLSLRRRQGRQLLLAAAVFLLTYPTNIGTRFLIPAVPFIALAMMQVLREWKAMAPLVVAAHALSAWPPYLKGYSEAYGMRWQRVPVKAALRIEPEENYLRWVSPDYITARLLDDVVPPGKRVLAYSPPPLAYTSRDVMVYYHAALNNNMADMIWGVRIRNWQPTRRLTFRFPAQTMRRLRLLQTAPKQSREYWSISEFRVLSGGRELPRDSRWRIRAHPNPWELDAAFDNNPMTRWRSWEPLSGREFVEVDLGRDEQIDSVALDTTPDQFSVRLELEAQTGGGAWHKLGDRPEASVIPPPARMREMIAHELRRQEIEYLLIVNSDSIAGDMRLNMEAWHLSLAGERGPARVYHIEE